MNNAPSIRLFVTAPLNAGAHLALDEKQAHYITQVMRLKTGNALLLFNGKDGEWLAELTEIKKRAATCHIAQQMKPQLDSPDIALLFAPVKLGRIDYLVEKATELGVRELFPVKTERTIVSRLNADRLTANMIEAAEQTERLDVPLLHPYAALYAVLEKWDATRPLFFCDESGSGSSIHSYFTSGNIPSPVGGGLGWGHGGHSVNQAPLLGEEKYKRDDMKKKCAILIGPEGGFSSTEQAYISALPYTIPLSLGPRILRADTAALAALTGVQIFLGDWR